MIANQALFDLYEDMREWKKEREEKARLLAENQPTDTAAVQDAGRPAVADGEQDNHKPEKVQHVKQKKLVRRRKKT